MAFVKFEEIGAWKRGGELVVAIYRLTAEGAFSRDWDLRDQIQRAAVSIASNAAEGQARRDNREFAKFLWIARGSAAEVQSRLHNAKSPGYISQAQFDFHYNDANLM